MLLRALVAATLSLAPTPAAAPPTPTPAQSRIPVIPDQIARAKFPKANQNEVDALATVNRIVNHSMIPMSDKEHYGMGDMWVMFPADGKGDCEDYALTKLGIIDNAGFPAVLYARIRGVLIHSKGMVDEGHALLELRLPDSGEVMFLDNRNEEPMTRKELEAQGYVFSDW